MPVEQVRLALRKRDGDAVNDMDAYEAILWFTSRGDVCLNARSFLSQFFFRKGALVIQVHK